MGTQTNYLAAERPVDVLLPTLATVRERCPVPDDTLCIYAAGSSVSGWSHRNSDLDLYVLTRAHALPAVLATAEAPIDKAQLDEAEATPRVSVAARDGERQWDVEYWSVDQLDEVFARFSDPLFAAALVEDPPFTDADVEFAHRLRTGVPLLGAAWLEQRRSHVDWAQVCRAVVQRKLDIVDSLVHEALGLLEDDEIADAALTMHVAFGHAVDAITLRDGILSVKPRWRAARVRAIASRDLPWDVYWKHETMAGFHADPRGWVLATGETCRELLLEIDENDVGHRLAANGS
jgi:hypothetical protein